MAVIKSVRKTCGETRWIKYGFRPSSGDLLHSPGQEKANAKSPLTQNENTTQKQ